MKLLDGKKVKEKILSDLKKDIVMLDRPLGLVVVQVGDDPASSVYVRQKEKMAQTLGYTFRHVKLSGDVTEKDLLIEINNLNNDDLVDGILVQMPIPKHLNSKIIQNAISPYKDVDGLTDINMGKLVHNDDCLIPCTPNGIMSLLKYYKIDVEGKNVVIVGRSDLVGKPLASLMINNHATVTLCHSRSRNLHKITKRADILVAAVGKANLITKDYIKNGTVVIDVGINRLKDGTLCGDVDFNNVKDKVSYITPVPGGVGQMTVAELAENTYKAYLLRNKKEN